VSFPWACELGVLDSFTDLVRGVVYVLGRHGGIDDAAGGRRGPAGPADRPEGRVPVVDDCVARGTVHDEADRFLRGHDGSGTQRTYAYYLMDHLRWLERECLALGKVQLRDLERYMGIVGAEACMPLGEPWRAGKRPYGRAALSAAAACLKGFYLHQATAGISAGLGEKLDRTRLPTRADRRRAFLGHVKTAMPANPASLAARGRAGKPSIVTASTRQAVFYRTRRLLREALSPGMPAGSALTGASSPRCPPPARRSAGPGPRQRRPRTGRRGCPCRRSGRGMALPPSAGTRS
jgi:hypothetical protein